MSERDPGRASRVQAGQSGASVRSTSNVCTSCASEPRRRRKRALSLAKLGPRGPSRYTPLVALLREGDVLASRFRLIRPLAHGGMGAVWVGEHMLLHVPVAIKLMGANVADHPSLRARFEREALAAAQLKSPHIVSVQDFGFEDGVPFMVMELLEGEDLAQRLQRVGRFAPAEVVELAIPIAKALTKAHQARVVHRDLKPANIFLARTDEGEVVKVLDFGIAKVVPEDGSTPEDPTSTNSLLGSPTYMSPEQVRAKRAVDARADLWAFAVILFRMLTSRVPFEGGSPGDLLVKVCTEPPRRVSEVATNLPPSLDAFFDRALQKEPSMRFQSAHELVNGLAAGLGLPPPFGGSRASLPEPLAIGAPPLVPLQVEHAQTLATNQVALRAPGRVPATTLALAAAPVLALAGIALVALWRASLSPPAAEPEAAAAAIVGEPRGAVEPSAAPAQAPPTVDASEASPSPGASASAAPSPSASASTAIVAERPTPKGRLPQPSAKPATKERIKFGL